MFFLGHSVQSSRAHTGTDKAIRLGHQGASTVTHDSEYEYQELSWVRFNFNVRLDAL